MDKLPRLLEEGLIHIAAMGVQQIYLDIVEEKAEELKQEYINTMKDRLQQYVETKLIGSTVLDGYELKVTVDIRGGDNE